MKSSSHSRNSWRIAAAAFSFASAALIVSAAEGQTITSKPAPPDDDDKKAAEGTTAPAARKAILQRKAPTRTPDAGEGISVPPPQARSGAALQPDLDITAKPFAPTHRVSATFRVQFQSPLLINAQNWPLYPWKAAPSFSNQTRPVREAVAVLEDGCGHYIKRQLSNAGAITFEWNPVNCGQGKITVWAVSPLNGRRVGVGSWIKGPVNSMSDLTANSGDYRPFSFVKTFNTNSAKISNGGLALGNVTIPVSNDASRGFFIMDNVQTALDYYEQLPGVSASELLKVNVVHTKNLKPANVDCDDWDANLKYAIFVPSKDPGFISIPWDCTDLGRDGHAHVHETSHYFQRLFLRQNPDYGRFGEGMANIQAALIRKTQWITTASGDTAQLENLDVNARMACWHDDDVAIVEDDEGQESRFRIDDDEDFADCEANGDTPVFPRASDWDASLANSGWFQRVVWDLIDAGSGETEPVKEFQLAGQTAGTCNGCNAGQFDTINGGGFLGDPAALALNDVLIFYLGGNNAHGKNDNYEDRGLDGLDLSDLVDGFICRGHTTAAKANDIVADAMGLDFNAAGGPDSCPHPED